MEHIIQPLRDNWKINEDAGFVPDQIKERVNSESNLEWAKSRNSVPLTAQERAIYMTETGNRYLCSSSSKTRKGNK